MVTEQPSAESLLFYLTLFFAISSRIGAYFLMVISKTTNFVTCATAVVHAAPSQNQTQDMITGFLIPVRDMFCHF